MPVMDGLAATRLIASLLARLSLRDRAQAVILAYETGLVVPGEAR